MRSGRGAFAATVGFGGLGRAVAFASAQFIAFASIATVIKNTTSATIEFESTLQKTVGLANVSQNAIGSLGKELLDLAPKIGVGPNELAKALYFVASAGISAANAMKVVKVSAQASEAGLGDVQIVADALTSAINAYGQANLSAVKAADIFVATVRAGKGEADAFAPSLGNVASVAASLKVRFSDVGAALAAITRLGVPAQTAAIELQQVFTNLLKTTPQAAKAFSSVGLSAGLLRKVFAGPGGLLAGLKLIKERFQGNTEAMARAFPNIRALRGILALVGRQSKEVAGIFGDFSNTTGSLSTAISAVANTTKHKIDQMKAAVQSLGITLGAAFAPIATKIAVGVTKGAEQLRKFFEEVGRRHTFTAKVKVVFTGLENITVGLGKRLGNLLGGAAGGEQVAVDFRNLFDNIGKASASVFATVQRVWPQIQSTIASVLQALASIAGNLTTLLGGAFIVALKAAGAVLVPLLSLIRATASVLKTTLGSAFAAGALAATLIVVRWGTLLKVAEAVIRVTRTVIYTFSALRAVGFANAAAAAAMAAGLSSLNPVMAGVALAVGLATAAFFLFRSRSDQLAAAQHRVADAIHSVETATRDLRSANLNQKEAALAVQQAEIDVATARRNLIAVDKNSKSSAIDRRQALVSLKEALLGVQRANLDYANASNKQISASNQQKKNARTLKETFDDLSNRYRTLVQQFKTARLQTQSPDPRIAQIGKSGLASTSEGLKKLFQDFKANARQTQALANALRGISPELANSVQLIANQAKARAHVIANLLGIPDDMNKLKPRFKLSAKQLADSIGAGLISGRTDVTKLINQLGRLPNGIKGLIPGTKAGAEGVGNAIADGIIQGVRRAIAALEALLEATHRATGARHGLARGGNAATDAVTAELEQKLAQARRALKVLLRQQAADKKSGDGKGGGTSTATKDFVLPFKLRLAQARAEATKAAADDIKVAKQIRAFILKSIPHLHGDKLISAYQQLASINNQIAGGVKQAAQQAAFSLPPILELQMARAQALGLPVIAALKKMIAAVKRALASGKLSIENQTAAWNQLKDLQDQMATALSEQPKKLQLALARAEALGLDTGAILRRMREHAQKALKAAKGNIDAQIAIWNEIKDLNDQISGQNTGNQTKFRHLGEQQQLAALGLGDLTGLAREKAAFRQAQIGPKGSIPGRTSPAFAGAGAGQENFVIHGGINIYAPKNWREIEEELRHRARQRSHSRR